MSNEKTKDWNTPNLIFPTEPNTNIGFQLEM